MFKFPKVSGSWSCLPFLEPSSKAAVFPLHVVKNMFRTQQFGYRWQQLQSNVSLQKNALAWAARIKLISKTTKFECLQVFLGNNALSCFEREIWVVKPRQSIKTMHDPAETCRLEPFLGHQPIASHRKGKKNETKQRSNRDPTSIWDQFSSYLLLRSINSDNSNKKITFSAIDTRLKNPTRWEPHSRYAKHKSYFLSYS